MANYGVLGRGDCATDAANYNTIASRRSAPTPLFASRPPTAIGDAPRRLGVYAAPPGARLRAIARGCSPESVRPSAHWARVATESGAARMVDSWEVRIVARRRPRAQAVARVFSCAICASTGRRLRWMWGRRPLRAAGLRIAFAIRHCCAHGQLAQADSEVGARRSHIARCGWVRAEVWVHNLWFCGSLAAKRNTERGAAPRVVISPGRIQSAVLALVIVCVFACSGDTRLASRARTRACGELLEDTPGFCAIVCRVRGEGARRACLVLAPLGMRCCVCSNVNKQVRCKEARWRLATM